MDIQMIYVRPNVRLKEQVIVRVEDGEKEMVAKVGIEELIHERHVMWSVVVVME
jgi:hypothetical protein